MTVADFYERTEDIGLDRAWRKITEEEELKQLRQLARDLLKMEIPMTHLLDFDDGVVLWKYIKHWFE